MRWPIMLKYIFISYIAVKVQLLQIVLYGLAITQFSYVEKGKDYQADGYGIVLFAL